MWEAFITDKNYANGELTLTVQYRNGADIHAVPLRTRTPDPDWPDRIIRARLLELGGLDALAAVVQVNAATPFVPAARPPRDPGVVAREALGEAVRVYEDAVRLNGAGTAIDLVPLKQAVADAHDAVGSRR